MRNVRASAVMDGIPNIRMTIGFAQAVSAKEGTSDGSVYRTKDYARFLDSKLKEDTFRYHLRIYNNR